MSISCQASRCSLRPTNSNRDAAGRASPNRSNPRTSTNFATPRTAWSEPKCARSLATATWGMFFPTVRGSRRFALLHQLRLACGSFPAIDMEAQGYGDYLIKWRRSND